MPRFHHSWFCGVLAAVAVASVTLPPIPLEAESDASLRGSRAGMIQQNGVAREHGLTFHRTAAEIHASVRSGELVELAGNADYDVADFVRYPYVVPSLRTFTERFSRQYREACGERLVVTSAVRPSNGQPRNAHALSVHPAGMALDLRVSQSAACRGWLEATLLSLERQGLINGIREFRPPHYHVAVFPEPYQAYVDRLVAREAEREARAAAARLADVQPTALLASGGGTAVMASEAAVQGDGVSPLGRAATALALTPLVILLLLGIVRIR